MPQVSVILPNYNYARFLKERVRSILAQTERDFELTYVDDASTDASNRIFEPFRADSRVQMRLFHKNSGTVYRRWNDAAAEANGEWLWFPNADDTAHPRFLECALAQAHANPSAALIHSRIGKMDATGRILALQLYGPADVMRRLSHDYFSPGYREIPMLAAGLYLVTASGLLVRRDAFMAVGGFDVRLWGVADYDFYLRLLHRYDIAYVAGPVVFQRIHGSNTTTTTRALAFDLAFTYAFAGAVQRMEGDSRYSDQARDFMLRSARSRLADVLANPDLSIPDSMRFALPSIYEVIPHNGLLRLMETHC
jgi:glycosyltransferase involved in cell wall biosynthesis